MKKENYIEDEAIRKLKNMKQFISKRYESFSTVDDKFLAYKFVKVQAQEIIDFIKLINLSPFKAVASYIKKVIQKDKEVFLYDFYLLENEFGEFEIDEERLKSLIMKDPVPEDDRQ